MSPILSQINPVHSVASSVTIYNVITFSFPGATNETLLQKFNSVHKENNFYEIPQRREAAFIVRHYAGKVKYQVSLCLVFLIHFNACLDKKRYCKVYFDNQDVREIRGIISRIIDITFKTVIAFF